MNVLIAGASGRTGRLLIAGARARGHTVTAFVRDPASMAGVGDDVRVVRGDLLDPRTIEPAMHGVDAVLVAVSGPYAEMTQNLIGAMQRAGIRRLVVLGAGFVSDDIPAVFRAFRNVFFRATVITKRAEEAVIARSGLDWVVVRATGMFDGPRGRRLAVSADGGYAGMRVTRADTAEFMLDQLTDARYLRRTPQIASS
jgi:putative NADH-flavin reductase